MRENLFNSLVIVVIIVVLRDHADPYRLLYRHVVLAFKLLCTRECRALYQKYPDRSCEHYLKKHLPPTYGVRARLFYCSVFAPEYSSRIWSFDPSGTKQWTKSINQSFPLQVYYVGFVPLPRCIVQFFDNTSKYSVQNHDCGNDNNTEYRTRNIRFVAFSPTNKTQRGEAKIRFSPQKNRWKERGLVSFH